MCACILSHILMMQAFVAQQRAIVYDHGPSQLRVNPGIKGLNYLLGSVPTWISFKDKEKAEV